MLYENYTEGTIIIIILYIIIIVKYTQMYIIITIIISFYGTNRKEMENNEK